MSESRDMPTSLLAAADALMDAVADCESDARRARASGNDSGEQRNRERAMRLRAVAIWLREIDCSPGPTSLLAAADALMDAASASWKHDRRDDRAQRALDAQRLRTVAMWLRERA